MPLWVTFLNLVLHLWGRSSLSKIESVVGKAACTYECTSRKLRVSYARMLIDVGVTQERKKFLSIRDADGSRINQEAVYEWVPKSENWSQL